MLFSVGKDRSLGVLKIVMALFIVIAPTLIGNLNMELSACVLFLVTALMFLARMRNTGKGYVSICQFVMMTLLFYSVVSTFWASNKSGHYTYILLISGLIMFFSLTAEYFSGNSDEKAQRRMMYMFSLSGAVCALWNFIYWVTALVPYGKKDGLMQGIGGSDFLAVFMLICIILTFKLLRGNRRSRKTILLISLILMGFTFCMTKSIVGWFLLAIFAGMYIITRKTKKFFVPMTLGFSAVFLVVVLIIQNGSEQGAVFKDVFNYGLKNLFGNGGGFWSAREIIFTGKYVSANVPGIFATLCAASGIVGIVCALALLARTVFHFIKLRSWVSAANVFITIMVMFLPLAKSPVMLFLWIGLIAYNENNADLTANRTFSKDTVKYVTWIIAVVSAFTTSTVCLNIAEINALNNYKDKNYTRAYSVYKVVSSVNLADADSCRMAAKSLYMSENIKENYEEAISLVDKAQKRDKYNLENMLIKAKIYQKCGLYELCAQTYGQIASRVAVKDSYNLETVKALYNIICTKEKGCTDAKALYENMLKISDMTQDLDYKEKINNIVDKALVYTKGELAVEK